MTSFRKYLILVLLLAGFTSQPVLAQQGLTYDRNHPPSLQEILDARETFEYEVKFGFLTLGWIDVELLPDTLYQGRSMYHMRTRIRSNSRVPLVGHREVVYESFFTTRNDSMFGELFWRDDVHEEEFDRVRILFERQAGQVIFLERGEPTDTLALNEPASGGDIVFYYSRLFAGTDDRFQLPVYIENEEGFLEMSHGTRTGMQSYDAFKEPINTYFAEGRTDIDGPFGFSGRYRSWYSTDDLRVPVEAHVRTIFGNVRVRLIHYEREN
ncbi:MAG: DUF3108 domain-containing protein [Balneolaceae bacterium]